jgi:Flp pilus assembly protein TadG
METRAFIASADRAVQAVARRMRTLVGERRGAAAVEFALILPALTLMLCGVFQYSILAFSYNVMLNTARNGARSLAIGTATEAQVITTAKASLPGWIPANAWTITPQDTGTTKTNQVTTRITVATRYATVMRLGPMPATLDVKVVMLKAS